MDPNLVVDLIILALFILHVTSGLLIREIAVITVKRFPCGDLDGDMRSLGATLRYMAMGLLGIVTPVMLVLLSLLRVWLLRRKWEQIIDAREQRNGG